MRLSPTALICALIIQVLLVMASSQAHGTPEYLEPKREFLELRSESSGEFSRRHFRDQFGKDVAVHIQYRDGTKGTLKYRQDSTIQELTVRFSDGSIKRIETYDKTGKVLIDGQERRIDGNLIWKATSAGSKLYYQSYYGPGRIFAQADFDLTTKSGRTSVFYESGKAWMDFKTSSNAFGFNDYWLWNREGKPIQHGSVGPDQHGELTLYLRHLDPSGAVEFGQVFALKQGSWLRNGTPLAAALLICKNAFVFDRSSGKPAKTYHFAIPERNLANHRIFTFDPKGGYEADTLRSDFSLAVYEKFGPQGQLFARTMIWHQNDKVEIPAKLMQVADPLLEAIKFWQLLESSQSETKN